MRWRDFLHSPWPVWVPATGSRKRHGIAAADWRRGLRAFVRAVGASLRKVHCFATRGIFSKTTDRSTGNSGILAFAEDTDRNSSVAIPFAEANAMAGTCPADSTIDHERGAGS